MKFIDKYVPKLKKYLENLQSVQYSNEIIFTLVLQSFELLIDNCSNIMEKYLNKLANVKILP